MLLRFVNHEGRQVELELGVEPLTIGRAPEAGLHIEGEKISRVHAEIRFWDGDYVLKDLKSTNGTCVNERRVDVAVIRPGDLVRIGSIRLQVEAKGGKGAKTILRELSQEMESGGKGYKTMLREIVRDAEAPREGKPEGGAPDPG